MTSSEKPQKTLIKPSKNIKNPQKSQKQTIKTLKTLEKSDKIRRKKEIAKMYWFFTSIEIQIYKKYQIN
jgi:hypothetical protein